MEEGKVQLIVEQGCLPKPQMADQSSLPLAMRSLPRFSSFLCSNTAVLIISKGAHGFHDQNTQKVTVGRPGLAGRVASPGKVWQPVAEHANVLFALGVS